MNCALRHVDLNITDRCNLACTYCSVPVKRANDPVPEFSLEQLALLFDEFEELGVELVRLVGGEPFVRRDIEAILRMVGHRKFATIVLTNGIPVRRHHIELIAQLPAIHSLAFSIDGVSAERHDGSRGCNAAFQRAVKSIDTCTELGIEHSMMTVVTNVVVTQLRELVAFASARAMMEVRFILLGYTGAAQGRPEAFPTWAAWRRAIVDLTCYLRDTPNLPAVKMLFPHEDPVPLELYGPLQDAGLLKEMESVWGMSPGWHGRPAPRGPSHCRAGRNNLSILPNGDAYGCDLMRNLPEFLAGNVLTHGVREVFERSPVLVALRRAPAVNGCASFDDGSQTFSCGQCRAGDRGLRAAGLLCGGQLQGSPR